MSENKNLGFDPLATLLLEPIDPQYLKPKQEDGDSSKLGSDLEEIANLEGEPLSLSSNDYDLLEHDLHHGASELPVGLTVLVLEDEEVLRETYVEVLQELVTSDAFAELGLPNLPEVEVIGYDSIQLAIDHFNQDPEHYKNRVIAAMVDLNLRGESIAKDVYAESMAIKEAEGIPFWKRPMSTHVSKEAYSNWLVEKAQELLPKYMAIAGAHGSKAVGELRANGLKVIIADINSGEDEQTRSASVSKLIARSKVGLFPLTTVNYKTTNDSDSDVRAVAGHILYAGSELLKAFNDPRVVKDLGLRSRDFVENSNPDTLAKVIGPVYHGLLQDHKAARFELKNLDGKYQVEDSFGEYQDV